MTGSTAPSIPGRDPDRRPATPGASAADADAAAPAGAPEGGATRPQGVARTIHRAVDRAIWIPAAALLALLLGLALRHALPQSRAFDWVWHAGLVVTGAPVVWRTVQGMLRGQFAADLVASFAIIGAVALDQPVAGLVIVLMQSGGEALERRAERRASAAVRALEASAPRIAHRVRSGDVLEDVTVDAVAIGDTLVVRPGEMVPCDAVVVAGRSAVDVSRLTGEPVPLAAGPGTELASGSLNGDAPLTVRALRVSAESQYARIVELVRSAQASKAPLQRLADRYATWFTPLAVAVCVLTYLASRDPLRVLAVLVVATPCPLILATPVAIIGGINTAARRQLVVRHGGALEQLASVTTVALDKTGTLTVGHPSVRAIQVAPGMDRSWVLAATAALERRSAHPLARPLVRAIEDELAHPSAPASVATARPPAVADVAEVAGQGVRGLVEGRDVVVGGRQFAVAAIEGPATGFAAVEREMGERGISGGDGDFTATRAYVAIDGQAAAVVEYEDALRPGLDAFLGDLRELGLERVILLSGDAPANAEDVGRRVGIPHARGGLLPQDKERVVRELVDAGERVVMLGDGTNDAPALSSATVGAALAEHGGGITAEAADVVILADDPGRLVDAIRIGRRTMRIARQSILAGLGLSAVAMVAAALGYVSPTVGAVLQEGIDVAVILNALRASR
jgi:heavy metal translocating P-type ATPase